VRRRVVKEQPLGIIDQRPTVAADQARLERTRPRDPVQRTGRTAQVAAIGRAGRPAGGLLADAYFDAEILGAERLAVGEVAQRETIGDDAQLVVIAKHPVSGHGQMPIHECERRAILERGVRRPFHANQPGGEHGKARRADGDDRVGMRAGVGGGGWCGSRHHGEGTQ
jgi:hypothetical protein